jgi:hypothetical protein
MLCHGANWGRPQAAAMGFDNRATDRQPRPVLLVVNQGSKIRHDRPKRLISVVGHGGGYFVQRPVRCEVRWVVLHQLFATTPVWQAEKTISPARQDIAARSTSARYLGQHPRVAPVHCWPPRSARLAIRLSKFRVNVPNFS